MTIEMIYGYWRRIRHCPAWGSMDWPDEAEAHFDALESWRNDLEKYGRTRKMPPRPEVDEVWAKSRRREYHAVEAAKIRVRLIDARIDAGRFARKGDTFGQRLFATFVSDLEGKLKKHSLAVLHLTKVQDAPGLADEMISRARAYPIGALIGTQQKIISCPLHKDETPSASIGRGFFYCFSCGASMDSIGWLMKTQGMNFSDAVRKLQ